MFIGISWKRVVSLSVFSTKIAIQILLVQIATFVKSKWGNNEAKTEGPADSSDYSLGTVRAGVLGAVCAADWAADWAAEPFILPFKMDLLQIPGKTSGGAESLTWSLG